MDKAAKLVFGGHMIKPLWKIIKDTGFVVLWGGGELYAYNENEKNKNFLLKILNV
ncbi:MAG: hypothetical protein RQ743_07015 [Bacteroidales bacterium]|nr:hypothetical protein [Bacteroidales bacterium]